MSVLGPIGVERFLREYWQKKPLLIRNATKRFENALSAEELAGLSLEQSVESRIVQWDPISDQWDLETGPFTEQDFSRLPQKNWTLLVQSVDQWVPEVAEILEQFYFLPRWRLDDVMISYAAPGGGVGPHFDYYDVFLLQVSGQRRWRLGQVCDESSALRVDQPLKLLDSFEQSAEHLLRPGDMLYVPAGVAHWGIAEDDGCVTWSIGFRAPSASELLVSAAERLAADLPESLRYQDPEQLRGGSLIDRSVDQGLEKLFENISKEDLIFAAKQAFISQVTEPRYLDSVEMLETEELDSVIEDVELGCALIERSSHSRFAYRVIAPDVAELFVDGICYPVKSYVAAMICDGEIEMDSGSEANGLIRELLKSGALIVI